MKKRQLRTATVVHGIRMFLLLMLVSAGVLRGEWKYGYWTEAKNYADINAAKKEARDSKRPLVVAMTKEVGCSNCIYYWNNVMCDGVCHHGSDKDCSVSPDYPIVKYAQEKKLVLVCFSPLDFSTLAAKISGKEYSIYMHQSAYYPQYMVLKVKEDADCTTEDANILNVGDDPGDKVEFICGYLGMGGRTVYDCDGKETKLKVVAHYDGGFDNFKSIMETIFADPTKTRGLTLDPQQDTEDDYKKAELLDVTNDHVVIRKNSLTIPDGKVQSWFKFSVNAGKRYWFDTVSAIAARASSGLTYEFFKATGTGEDLAPTGAALPVETDASGVSVAVGTYSGMMFLKLTRQDGTGDYTYNMKVRRTGDTAGSSLSKAQTTCTAGKWTTSFTAAKAAGKPMVLAFAKDIWSDDAQVLDAYSEVLTSKLTNTNFVRVDAAPQDIVLMATSTELLYLRADGSVVGHLTAQPDFAPAEEGTITLLKDFSGANADVFPKFKLLTTDETECYDNYKAGAMVLQDKSQTTTSLIGGLDPHDWYQFVTVDAAETWIFSMTSPSNGAVTATVFNGDGRTLATASGDMNKGLTVSVQPNSVGETLFVKVVADSIASPVEYTLSAVRKVVDYAVSFGNAVKRPLLSSKLVSIPVRLTENNEAAGKGAVSVKVNVTIIDSVLRKLDLLDTEGKVCSELSTVVTWSDEEKKTTPVKTVTLDLTAVQESGASWDGHKDVALTFSDFSENSIAGIPDTMTVEVYSKVDSPTFEDGDEVAVNLTGGVGESTPVSFRIAAPETAAIFWELIDGTLPEGAMLSVEKEENGYVLKLTPGNIPAGSYSFKVKIYSLISGNQIKGGGILTVNCLVNNVADVNPFGSTGNAYAGAVFDSESIVEQALDVTGTLDVAVKAEGIEATVKTQQGDVELKATRWDSIDTDTHALTVTMQATKDSTDYELTLTVDATGAGSGTLNVAAPEKAPAAYPVMTGALPKDAAAAFEKFAEAYTEELQPITANLAVVTDGTVRGFGGMAMSLDKTTGIVTYSGFLPEGGKRFSGSAKAWMRDGEEPYMEFTVFAKVKDGTEQTEQWFGALNRIYLKDTSEGSKTICLDCNSLTTEPLSYPVWYRDGGVKMVMQNCGSSFDTMKTLTAQLSDVPVNRYYLMVDRPPKLLDGGGEALIAPRRMELTENEEGSCIGTGDSLFGVALALNVARQGQGTGDAATLFGEFSGMLDLYSRGFENNNTLRVNVHGILVAASEYCCSPGTHPVGLGYYELTEIIGGEPRTTSYPVRIYWAGKSIEDLDEPSADLSVKTVNGEDWKDIPEQSREVSGLEEGGAQLALNESAAVLAVNDNGQVIILPETQALGLAGGRWTLWTVDVDGIKGEGTPVNLTVSDTEVAQFNLTCGWNLIGMPWTLVSLAGDSAARLKKMSMMTLSAENAVVICGIPSAGQACWVFAETPGIIRLAGQLDEQKPIPELPKTGLFFGTDPGPVKRSGGWIWRGQRYVQAPADTGTAAGGFWMMK